MSDRERIERRLSECVAALDDPVTPNRLRLAIRDAVFPGGSRLRPSLCLAVARACGDPNPALADAAAASIELIHSASLVHDDLPCFDDAPLRRGRPTVHTTYGEEIAVLAGDGLIVMAFETLASGGRDSSVQLAALVTCVSTAAGAARGLVSGQAWESEPRVGLTRYHRAKTAALFEASARAGAIAAKTDPRPWADFGSHIGEAYQIFDDLRDAGESYEPMDKPMGQDRAHGRPNASHRLGAEAAGERLRRLLAEAEAAIPPCPRPHAVLEWMDRFSTRLRPVVESQPAISTSPAELAVAAGLTNRG